MSAASPRDGVLLLTGYGIQVKVERGHLAVEDGVGATRRYGRFHRADRDIKRLVVVGHAGTITLDALRWLSDVGAGFMQIDSDGKVIAAAGPIGLQDARLRRAQALTAENGRGLVIARELAREKLEGQASVLDKLPDSEQANAIVQDGISRISAAKTVEQLRAIEAEGALAYWRAWSLVEIRFARRDAKRIPRHWRRFGRRASLVTGNARKATNPCNAILNYLYAIAEAEARIAALAVGCDPGLGVMHADQKMRDSLACDLMEPVRPVVDRWVLQLLAERTFRKSDFFETREGVCRIMPPLTQLLAETTPRWAAAVAPIAEWLVRELLKSGSKKESRRASRTRQLIPTPLTQANRSAGREGIRKAADTKRRRRTGARLRTCTICGAALNREQRRYCLECRPIQTQEAVSKAHEALRARRLAGKDPAHGGKAAKRRGKRNSAALRANADWESQHSGETNTATFTQEIAPSLATVSLAQMMNATGLSRPYCAMIRRGERVPHARHWETLRALAS